jgi:actin-like ATPase involved in cell morphogenesis
VADWTLAIDFGTTSTAAAMRVGDVVERVELDGAPRMPSMVFWRDGTGGTRTGRLVLGEEADELSGLAPWCLERTPKRHIGDEFIRLGEQELRVVDVIGAILRRVVEEAIRLRGGAPPAEVRLTHPARWGQTSLQKLADAADLAGLGSPEFVAEPVAAATHFASERLSAGEYVAVYDLGGGTFDTAVLRRSEDSFDLIGAPGGNENLGGEDFDDRLYRYLGRQLSHEKWSSLRESTERVWTQANRELLRNARRAKEVLSRSPQYEFYMPPPIDQELLASAQSLRELIMGDVEATVTELERTVRSAGVDPTQLAAIYLAGGCSRIPLIGQMIKERLGQRPECFDDPKLVTVLGAARLRAIPTSNGRVHAPGPGDEPVGKPILADHGALPASESQHPGDISVPLEEVARSTVVRADAPTLDETVGATALGADPPALDETVGATVVRADPPALDETVGATVVRADPPALDETVGATVVRADAPTPDETVGPTALQTDASTLGDTLGVTAIGHAPAVRAPVDTEEAAEADEQTDTTELNPPENTRERETLAEPSDRGPREPAEPDPSGPRHPFARRRLIALAVLVAAVAGVAAAAVIATSGGTNSPAKSKRSPGKGSLTATSGPLTVSYVAPWRALSAPVVGVDALTAPPIQLTDGHATLAAGQLMSSAAVPGDPPPLLVSRYGRPATSANATVAHRNGRVYTWTSSGTHIEALVLPAASGDLAVICSASSAPSLSKCASVASGARTSNLQLLPPGPDASFGARLTGILKPVASARSSLGKLDQSTLGGRVGPARHLAAAELKAAHAIQALREPGRYGHEAAALVGALDRESSAFSRLASAASASNRGAYTSELKTVGTAGRRLQSAGAALKPARLGIPQFSTLKLAAPPPPPSSSGSSSSSTGSSSSAPSSSAPSSSAPSSSPPTSSPPSSSPPTTSPPSTSPPSNGGHSGGGCTQNCIGGK